MKSRYLVETYDPASSHWDDIATEIMGIEHDAFGDLAFDEEYLEADFVNEDNVVILLRDHVVDRIIGFTYAVPIGEMDETREYESCETAYICDTILDRQHRGQGLVGKLMGRLEAELRQRGYRYIERDASIAGNYARNIAKHYDGRIELRAEPHTSDWGQQIYFRIRL